MERGVGGIGNAEIGELHRPTVAEELRAVFIGNFLTRNRAGADDSVVVAGGEAAEEEAPLIAKWEPDGWHGDGAGIEDERGYERFVHAGEFAEVGGEQTGDFGIYKRAFEGAVLSFVTFCRCGARAERILTKPSTDSLGHTMLAELCEGILSVLHFFGVFLPFVGFFFVGTGFPGDFLIAAIVGIPTEDIPELWPREGLRAVTGEDARGKEPRRRVAAAGTMTSGEFGRSEDAEVSEQFFHARDPLASCAHVAAL